LEKKRVSTLIEKVPQVTKEGCQLLNLTEPGQTEEEKTDGATKFQKKRELKKNF